MQNVHANIYFIEITIYRPVNYGAIGAIIGHEVLITHSN